VDRFLSIRLRVLVGSRQECMYQLMELGIPQQAIPTDERNRLKLGYHRRWMQQRRELEAPPQRQEEPKEKQRNGSEEAASNTV
jgi:hypothetical protein